MTSPKHLPPIHFATIRTGHGERIAIAEPIQGVPGLAITVNQGHRSITHTETGFALCRLPAAEVMPLILPILKSVDWRMDAEQLRMTPSVMQAVERLRIAVHVGRAAAVRESLLEAAALLTAAAGDLEGAHTMTVKLRHAAAKRAVRRLGGNAKGLHARITSLLTLRNSLSKESKHLALLAKAGIVSAAAILDDPLADR